MNLPITEKENPNTVDIDRVSTFEAIRLINTEDKLVAKAVERTLASIGETIDNIVDRLRKSGRSIWRVNF